MEGFLRVRGATPKSLEPKARASLSVFLRAESRDGDKFNQTPCAMSRIGYETRATRAASTENQLHDHGGGLAAKVSDFGSNLLKCC